MQQVQKENGAAYREAERLVAEEEGGALRERIEVDRDRAVRDFHAEDGRASLFFEIASGFGHRVEMNEGLPPLSALVAVMHAYIPFTNNYDFRCPKCKRIPGYSSYIGSGLKIAENNKT